MFANLPSFEIYLEENRLRRQDMKESRRQGLSWYLVPLPQGASGKTLYIGTFDTGSSVDIEDLSIGSQRAATDILEQQIKLPLSSDVPSIVYGLFFSLFGYIVIVLSLYLPSPSKRAALTFGVLGALYGTRILADSQLSRLVFDAKPIAWDYLNDFLTYLIPVASTLFFEQIVGRVGSLSFEDCCRCTCCTRRWPSSSTWWSVFRGPLLRLIAIWSFSDKSSSWHMCFAPASPDHVRSCC